MPSQSLSASAISAHHEGVYLKIGFKNSSRGVAASSLMVLAFAWIELTASASAWAQSSPASPPHSPPPAAIAHLDLDGDGTNDEIRIGQTAAMTATLINPNGSRQATLIPFTHIHRVSSADITAAANKRGATALAVVYEDSQHSQGEAMWIDFIRGKPTLRWSGPVGII